MFERDEVQEITEILITNGPLRATLEYNSKYDMWGYRIVLRTPSGRNVGVYQFNYPASPTRVALITDFEHIRTYISDMFKLVRADIYETKHVPDPRDLRRELQTKFRNIKINLELTRAILEFLLAENFIRVVKYHPNVEYEYAG